MPMPNKKNISKNDKKLLKNEKVYVSILAIKHAFSISGRKEYMRYDDVILRWAKIATILFTAMAVVADVFGIIITR